MANVTYYVVVPFLRDEDGMLTPGEAKEAPNGEIERRRAQAVATATGNVGGIAFSRTIEYRRDPQLHGNAANRWC